MSSTWSSGIGKFPKKDPNHGIWGKKIKHWVKHYWRKLTGGKCCGGGCDK